MAKRNWPDHPAIGRTVTYAGSECRVVDVKAGPAYFNTAELEQQDVTLHGTLKLRLKYPGGAEVWTPPMDGDSLVAWCAKKDAEALATGGHR